MSDDRADAPACATKFNGAVQVDGVTVDCGHLSFAYLMAPSKEAFLDQVGSTRENIAAYFKGRLSAFETHVNSLLRLQESRVKHLVSFARYGTFLQDMAARLAGNAANLLVLSTRHIMACHLEWTPDRRRLGISAYDPNMPGRHVRVDCTNPDLLLRELPLEQFFPDYAECAGDEPFVTVISADIPYQQPSRLDYLDVAGSDGEMTQGHVLAMHQALAHGLPDVVEDLARQRSPDSPENWIALIAANNQQCMPGLAAALQKWQLKSIAAFATPLLLRPLPHDDFIRLLAARGPDGVPGFAVALDNGNVGVIDAYAALLHRCNVAASDVADLLAARASTGEPGATSAYRAGNTGTINALGRIAGSFPLDPQDHLSLIAADGPTGRSGLAEALLAGRRDFILLYGHVVNNVPVALEAKRHLIDSAAPWVDQARADGLADTVNAYNQLRTAWRLPPV
ncbi:MAG: hypothetical protein ABWY00_08405 [Dongiaceae bacterium]